MNAADLADVTAHGLALIAKIVDTLKDAHAGKVTPSEALSAIGELHDEILTERDATDKALHEKFDTGKSG